ncbi:MAG: hypothetical protein JNL87_07575 [Burkholderiaceae bacterium]|nr:hypothetical protein [Burkholderiaceae bacterium]
MLSFPAARAAPTDGWVGPPELPGYRAGNVVARLADLPSVYPDHLYFHLLLLDAGGRLQDDHSGPCYALPRQQPADERSRFVRVVAELLRHSPSEDRGLSALGQALTVIRQLGVDADRLILAAQLLDDVSSERAVVLSLIQMLELSLGADEAPNVMGDVVAGLAHRSALGSLDEQGRRAPLVDVDQRIRRINGAGLDAQVSFVVHTVGKAKARRHLREAIHFALVPTPELFGV